MVAIAPFRALRYNLDRVRLSDVVCPPYDVIAPAQRQQLCQRSPYNFVRLEVPADGTTGDRYASARQILEAWTQHGVLVRDSQPAVYLSEHTFTWSGRSWRRLGWIAVLSLDGPVTQRVLSHEATFEAPKADRTRLLTSVRAQLSPIFCVVPDATSLLSWLQDVMHARAPTATAQVKSHAVSEEIVRLWTVTDPQVIARLQQELTSKAVLIADGHHRFSVALNNRDLCRGVMTYFACAEDPALHVHPIHRVVRMAPVDPAVWEGRLRNLCDATPMSSLDELTRRLEDAKGRGQFGYYAHGRYAHVAVRPTPGEITGEAAGIASLDVTVLHKLVLPHLFGEAPKAETFQYTPYQEEAIRLADESSGGCAWLLRPLPLSHVFALASQRVALPQKSTYFYPKAFAGLVVYPFDPA